MTGEEVRQMLTFFLFLSAAIMSYLVGVFSGYYLHKHLVKALYGKHP